MLFWDLEVGSHTDNNNIQTNMAQNMNATLKALVQEIYETEGLTAVRGLVKEIQTWTKDAVEMEKRGAEEEKRAAADTKMLAALKKESEKQGKALIKDLRKNETFKALKKSIAEAEKDARKVRAEAKKLAAAEAKANKPTKEQQKAAKGWSKLFTKTLKSQEKDAKKVATQLKSLVKLKKAAVAKALKAAKPSKDEVKQVKRWDKVLTKGIKRGESETKKAIAQLKKLAKTKKQADAKADKAAAKAAKAAQPKQKKTKKKAVEEAAVGDDLIATLLAKAKAPELPLALEVVETDAELIAEIVESEDDEEELVVTKFEWEGVKYLKDGEDYLFDPETQEEIGTWNAEEQKVELFDDE